MSRYDDDDFDEEWEESATLDAAEELTETLGREPTEQEIEALVSEMRAEAEAMRAEADAENREAGRRQRREDEWNRWVDSM